MRSISFKLLLLVSLLVVVSRYTLAYEDSFSTDEECRRNCLCDVAYCDKSRDKCDYGFMNRVDVRFPKHPYISKNKDGNGR
ncbi:unnamed protein product [Arabidopsis thaliana]|uniref:Uncharacterized protein n=1 Tax=Arabidopsis thaliana TaxID=3702 RepID=A0A5S9XIG4_ARATH|nr:unnamed protein product [Arabidopsis thaliana]